MNTWSNIVMLICISVGCFQAARTSAVEVDTTGRKAGNTQILVSPLTTTQTRQPLLILNAKGDTLKMKKSDVRITNFARWKYDGKTRYSYFLEDTSFYKTKGVNYFTGYQVVTDTNLNEIKRIKLLSHKNIDANRQPGLDYHDFIIISDVHFITLAYYEIVPANIPDSIPHQKDMKVVTPVVQEILNDKVVWQWVATDYPELYAPSFYANDSGVQSLNTDYLHVNSVFLDKTDGNLIVSCRNSNQILKLNRNNGAIIWKLGGHNSDFPLSPELAFLGQHHVTKCNANTLLFIDNGKKKKREASRITECTLDEVNKKIKAIKHTPLRLKFVEFGGSVQKFANSYFVNGGTGNFIIELAIPKGNRLSRIPAPEGAYRALKYAD